jgi:hypothetical protein
MDFTLESLIDSLLRHAKYGELYVYQSHLIVIGLRLGILLSVPCT